MENMRLLDFLLVTISSGLGWFGKVLWDAVGQLRKDMTTLETNLPKEYVRKVDWDRSTDRLIQEIRDFRSEITGQFDSLWREMKEKADK